MDCGGCLMVVRPSEACCPEPYPAEGLVRFGCIGGEAVSLSHRHHLTGEGWEFPEPTGSTNFGAPGVPLRCFAPSGLGRECTGWGIPRPCPPTLPLKE